MKQWQKDAIKLVRKARRYAIETSDDRLHQACSRSIEAMVKEAAIVPSGLRIYARETREHYEHLADPADLLPSLSSFTG